MPNRLLLLGLFHGTCWFLPSLLVAQQPLRLSPDTTIVLGGFTVADQVVAEDDQTGGIILPNIGNLPSGADLTAYHQLPSGDQLLAFDITVVLATLTVEPGDVVRFTGSSFALEFDASAEGLPSGAYVDAVTHDGFGLVLSFDNTVDLGAFIADDADLVRFDGVGFTLFFDAQAAGVPRGLDLDGAHILENTTLLLSMDTSGNLGGVTFDDEDILGFDPATFTWSLVYDGSAEYPAWTATDLNALAAGLIGQPVLVPTLNGRSLLLMTIIMAVAGYFALARSGIP